ncbi:MAG TPA: hypothetical protein DEQ88_03010 [Clostridiales bacterium]|nr:hypothetical protein [Clostridiales bacterium]
MKRKLLAAIMLIVLAFGVMAFAACEEKQNDNEDVLTVETVPGGCLRTDLRLAVEIDKQISLDAPIKLKVKFGHVSEATVPIAAKLSVYNGADMMEAKTYAEKAKVPTTILYETSDFVTKKNYIKHKVDENGCEYDLKYPLSLKVEIPKEHVSREQGSLSFLLSTISLDGTFHRIEASVTIRYEIRDGEIYFFSPSN